MHSNPRTVIFADLDGALLETGANGFAAASDALELLSRQGLPLVLCSSKTRLEIELLQQDLRIRDPFISENGGALFLPRGYFRFVPLYNTRPIGSYEVMEFGTPYDQLVEILHRTARDLAVRVLGFSDMSIEEVARACKISLLEARLAKTRDYGEPFRILDSNPTGRSRLLKALRQASLRCTRAGGYYHLTGLTTKGFGVSALRSFYEQAWGKVLAVGIGDRLDDISLLQEVDIPVLVKRSAGDGVGRLLRKIPHARVTKAFGMRGWTEAIQAIVAKQVQADAKGAAGLTAGR